MYKVIIGKDFGAYNEYDTACGGGYFECPYCGEQLYNTAPEDGNVDSCDSCGNEFMYEED